MATKKEELGHLQMVMDFCKHRLREASELRGMHQRLKRRGTLNEAENRKIRNEADAILGSAAAQIPTMQDFLDHEDLHSYLTSLNA